VLFDQSTLRHIFDLINKQIHRQIAQPRLPGAPSAGRTPPKGAKRPSAGSWPKPKPRDSERSDGDKRPPNSTNKETVEPTPV
jgi:hypothetical protein